MDADETEQTPPTDELRPYRSEAIALASYAVRSSNSCSDHEEPWRRIAKAFLAARKPLLDALEQARKERDGALEAQKGIWIAVREAEAARNNAIAQRDQARDKLRRAVDECDQWQIDATELQSERDQAQQSAKDARALLARAQKWVPEQTLYSNITKELRERINGQAESDV